MGVSTTPRPPEPRQPTGGPDDDSAADAAFVVWARPRLGAGQGGLVLAVAYSGGADSTALLAAAARHWPGPVVALHVHHGLQAAADAFEAHCRAQCRRWQVPLQVVRLDARHASGASPEEAAREARYRALADMASGVGAHRVLLAQHADDQAETLLLALSRGAGVAGLASMPASFERHGARFERPLLALPAAQIRRDLRTRGVPFIDDPSNADLAYTRNRIRRQVLPALEQALPGFRATFARSARHAAQAQALLDELAEADLAAVGQPPEIGRLQALSRPRQANVLRRWLRRAAGRSGSTAQLEALLDQVAACTTRGHQIRLKAADGHVLREGAFLAFRPGPL